MVCEGLWCLPEARWALSVQLCPSSPVSAASHLCPHITSWAALWNRALHWPGLKRSITKKKAPQSKKCWGEEEEKKP